ncbi:hypothetical protein R3P38DRAFT_3226954 [Favolaschia claudopus]|uniref:Uncharacterized protein n=1 Tax=Favolaschia claudopus TaxID=2862362 RepID=A0AAV9ZTB7_9AGAR
MKEGLVLESYTGLNFLAGQPRAFEGINHLAKVDLFPVGSGWKGVHRLKQWQDTNLEPDQRYIRKIIEVSDFPLDEFDTDSDNPITTGSPASTLRIIICMSLAGSERLAKAQYILSDIAFSRIEEVLEFEMAAMDRIANTSVVFLRVYLNRQTAAAHQLIFREIECVVGRDTGRSLQWRHLHATSATDVPQGMVLQWTCDQHGGQAKGIGLRLQDVAQAMPTKHDLHEPERLLSSLGPYDHLRRIFRLCSSFLHEPSKLALGMIRSLPYNMKAESPVQIGLQTKFVASSHSLAYGGKDVWKAEDGLKLKLRSASLFTSSTTSLRATSRRQHVLAASRKSALALRTPHTLYS